MDPQEEPLLSEAYSCSTLLTECGGTIDNTDAKSALLNSEVKFSVLLNSRCVHHLFSITAATYPVLLSQLTVYMQHDQILI